MNPSDHTNLNSSPPPVFPTHEICQKSSKRTRRLWGHFFEQFIDQFPTVSCWNVFCASIGCGGLSVSEAEAAADKQKFMRVGKAGLGTTSAVVRMTYPIGVYHQNFGSSKALLRTALAVCFETRNKPHGGVRPTRALNFIFQIHGQGRQLIRCCQK